MTSLESGIQDTQTDTQTGNETGNETGQSRLVNQFVSTLPANDDHPYRTKAWRPQTREWNAVPQVTEGEIPTDLDGVYLRDTENPLFESMRMYHPYDGDGMVQMMAFRDGQAMYRNRFVRTDGFVAEQVAGESLWAGVAEPPSLTKVDYGWGARGLLKDTSSTDVVVHGGQVLTSWYQCGDLYRLDGTTLDTIGKQDWHGKFPWGDGVSAHPKVDEHTGEMLFFNYSTEAPYMHYGVVDADHNLTNYCDIPLPGPRLTHDMVFSEHYSILNDCPMFWDPEALKHGKHAVRFFPEIPTRLGVIPRHGATDDLRWFEFDPTYVLHWTNAWEDGDWLIAEGFFQSNPAPQPDSYTSDYDRAFRFLLSSRKLPRLHRWMMNLATGETKEHDLTDQYSEFGMFNAQFATKPHRYTFSAVYDTDRFQFPAFLRIDTETGNVARVQLPDGVYASETVVAPKVGSTSEDDSYVLTFTIDTVNDLSECLVFDATDIEAGPVVRLRLPERISSGTHATWAPGTAVDGWDEAWSSGAMTSP